MSIPTLQGLRICVERLDAEPESSVLRAEYAKGLSRLHEAVFHDFTDVFKNGFYLKFAKDIAGGKFTKYPGANERLLPLAKAVVQTENLFKQTLMEVESYPFRFPEFFESYKIFYSAFMREAEFLYKDTPYFFRQRNPVTVAYFQSILEDLKTKRPDFNALFEVSDPGALSVLMNWAILSFVKTPQEPIPEIFRPHLAPIEKLRKVYIEESRADLERVLLGLKDGPLSASSQNIFLEVGRLKSLLGPLPSLYQALNLLS